MPDDRRGHSVTKSGLLCGGWYTSTRDSCLQWNRGSWEASVSLDVERYDHVSWTPGTGVGTYLMGGYYSESWRTTTLIRPDGTQEPGFPLKYDT